MAEPRIRPKRSSTASSVPTAGQLSEGELAINLADGKLYSKNASGTIVQLATAASSATTATTATYIAGGAGGSIPYQSAANTTAMLANGTSGQLLKSNGGTAAPSWYTITKTDVGLSAVENTALSTWAGSTNLTTLGTVASGTWSATTIATTKGGTGLTSYTLGDTVYSSASNTLAKLAGNTTTTKKFLRQTGTGTASAAPAWDTVTSTDVGLGNVEDTALSTWTGSANITTVGTLSALDVSGTTTINSLTYPSTDGTSGQVLSTNGAGTLSWTTAGGASAAGSTGDVQYNDGSGNLTASSYFSYGSSAYDALALYSANGAFGVFGIFAASGQTYPLLEFRDYTGATVYSYFDATGHLYLNAQTNVRFADADSSHYAAIQAPATISSNYTLTLPTTAGTSNYVLKTNGSGTLSWTNAISNLIGGNSTTLLGSIPYQSNTDTTTLLSPNTTTARKFLRQTGTGTNGAAPGWDAIYTASTTAPSSPSAGDMWYDTNNAALLLYINDGNTSQWVEAGSPSVGSASIQSNGRLTLESGVPVSSTDQTAKTTVYYTPYDGNFLSLYNGTSWNAYSFSELSLTTTGLSANSNYDIFAYVSGTTVTLEYSSAWTNDTTRSNALSLLNGIYVKSSDNTRRYLGSIRSNASTQFTDSAANRLVWNFNNKVLRHMYAAVYSGTHVYNGGAREWNNGTGVTRLYFLTGINGETFSANGTFSITSGGFACNAWFGVDSTTVQFGSGTTDDRAAVFTRRGLTSIGQVNLGFHYLTAIQSTEFAGTSSYLDVTGGGSLFC